MKKRILTFLLILLLIIVSSASNVFAANIYEWKQVANPTTRNINTIAYNGTNLYAIGDGYGNIFTSGDGITWNSAFVGTGFDKGISKIIYGNGMFIAIGLSKTLLRSIDGISWIPQTCPEGVGGIPGIIYDGTKFVLGSATGQIITSTNGVDWTLLPNTIGSGELNCLSYANGKYMADNYSNELYVSEDLIIWTKTNYVVSGLKQIIYANNIYILQ